MQIGIATIVAGQEASATPSRSVWVAEAWGQDAFTPLAYLAARAERIALGTGGRPPNR